MRHLFTLVVATFFQAALFAQTPASQNWSLELGIGYAEVNLGEDIGLRPFARLTRELPRKFNAGLTFGSFQMLEADDLVYIEGLEIRSLSFLFTDLTVGQTLLKWHGLSLRLNGGGSWHMGRRLYPYDFFSPGGFPTPHYEVEKINGFGLTGSALLDFKINERISLGLDFDSRAYRQNSEFWAAGLHTRFRL